MRLYDITTDFKEAIKEFREDENPTEELINRLEFLNLTLDDKLENCCAFYKNYLIEAETFKAESKRLKQQADLLEARAEKFKEYVNGCLGGGGAKWKSGVHQIGWKASSSVEVTDINALPTKFIKYKEVLEPDKKGIGEALKKKQIVPGAILVEKNNIQIK